MSLAKKLLQVNIPGRKKPAYMTESISTEEARVEVDLLRVKMYHSCGTYTGEKFLEISDQLCFLLKVL